MKIGLGLLQRRMEHSGNFKKALLNFFAANGVKVSLDKTIAEVIRYHQQALAVGVNRFFTGAVATTSTNMNNSFTPPEGEHMIVLGIRFLDGVAAAVEDTAWGYGATVAPTQNGTYQIVTNGIKVLTEIPGTAHNPNLTTDDEGILWLSEPVLWKAQTALDLDLTLLSAPAANTNGRFEVIGIGLVS